MRLTMTYHLPMVKRIVIAVLRRVPGVSAELDRRAGRFPLR
jgi:hypothetical protein